MKYLIYLVLFLSTNCFANADNFDSYQNESQRAPVIGIMGVDEFELGNLFSYMEPPVTVTQQGMRKAYSGKLWGIDTVIFMSNEEKAAASSAMVDMILQHHVDAVIFIGTAGALDKRLNIGDIVIPQKLIQYDVDFRPYVPLFHIPFSKNREFFTDATLRNLAVESAEEFLTTEMSFKISPEVRKEMYIEHPKVVQDMIGTADCFLISENHIKNLQRDAKEVSSIDMEGAAAAQTASDYQIPFTLIRTVSNYVESPLPEQNLRVKLDYGNFVKKVQYAYTDGIIKNLFARIKASWDEKQSLERNVEKELVAQVHQHADVGIICSLPDEAEAIAEVFSNPPEIIEKGSRKYYLGNIGNTRVALVASGIGKASVAAAATDLILRFKVKHLVNTGIANGVVTDHLDGDILISENLVEHDVDVRPFRPVFELSTISVSRFPSDSSLSKKISQVIAHTMPQKRYFLGDIASGDRFVSDPIEVNFLRDNITNLVCIDSEAAPEAHIAYLYGVPFVSIKIISKMSNQFAPIDTSLDSKEMHLKTINEIIKNIFLKNFN